MNILITGGSGFIGSSLIKLLSNNKKNNLLCISRSKKKSNNNIKWIKGDLEKYNNYINIIQDFKPEILIYLAWDKIPNFNKINCKKNYKLAKRFIDAIINLQTLNKIIISGSCFEYKNPKGKIRINHNLDRKNFFSYFKNKLKEYLEKKLINKKINLLWLRIFYVYGQNQRDKSLIPYIINSIKNNKIPKISNPYGMNDFIYVEDLSKIILKLIDKKFYKNKIINVGSGKLVKIKNIMNIIQKKINPKIKIKLENKKNDQKPIYFWADNGYIKYTLGFKNFTNISKGIDKMIKIHKHL